jgi:transketolase C-terminal domain/subunit
MLGKSIVRHPKLCRKDKFPLKRALSLVFLPGENHSIRRMFIAEQQLVGAAVGLSVLGKPAFASTFACFFTRAYDQIRMAAISNATIHLSGSHAGVSIGEDGPSQMALEDLAMMRAVCDSTVLYPCDANQTAQLVGQMVDLKGISWLRTTREKTPIIYPASEKFPIAGSKVVKQSGQDKVAVVAAAITLHEALKAFETLKGGGVAVRIIDAYSVKPIDRALRWCKRPRTPAAKSWWSKITGSKAAWAMPCWKHTRRRAHCRV